MTKPKTININQVEDTFKSIEDADVRSLGLSLTAELKFMKQTLTKLKKEIKDKGVVTSMSQGKYEIERANPAIASYNTMVKNYNSTIKQLFEILNSSNVEKTDSFDEDDLM